MALFLVTMLLFTSTSGCSLDLWDLCSFTGTQWVIPGTGTFDDGTFSNDAISSYKIYSSTNKQCCAKFWFHGMARPDGRDVYQCAADGATIEVSCATSTDIDNAITEITVTETTLNQTIPEPTSPSPNPTANPTSIPTKCPTIDPTTEPTSDPTIESTSVTINPTLSSTKQPNVIIVAGSPTERSQTSTEQEMIENTVQSTNIPQTDSGNKNHRRIGLMGGLIIVIGCLLGLCCIIWIRKCIMASKIREMTQEIMQESIRKNTSNIINNSSIHPMEIVEPVSAPDQPAVLNLPPQPHVNPIVDTIGVEEVMERPMQPVTDPADESHSADSILMHGIDVDAQATVGGTKNDNENVCGHCQKVAMGKIDDDDDVFYCNGCWDSY